MKIRHFLMTLLHFTIICALEFIYVCFIYPVVILYNCASLFPSPQSVTSHW